MCKCGWLGAGVCVFVCLHGVCGVVCGVKVESSTSIFFCDF